MTAIEIIEEHINIEKRHKDYLLQTDSTCKNSDSYIICDKIINKLEHIIKDLKINELAKNLNLTNCKDSDIKINEVLTYFDDNDNPVRCVVSSINSVYKKAVVVDWLTRSEVLTLKYSELWREND